MSLGKGIKIVKNIAQLKKDMIKYKKMEKPKNFIYGSYFDEKL